ncbi:DUF1648 domain-containing protein [Oceanobacillus kapialis]|uniref:DUF1648 domain-containing protein n=1 Tax=Oceanobacillus kapialis TaxID=481353 RepID=A0ABW5Q2X3_9BACI
MAEPGKRPKLKIPKTKTEWIADVIGYTAYVGSIVFFIYSWGMLPDEVPAHYNAMGEVDRWGSKFELLILPIVGALVGGMCQVFERFPESHNYPERLNEENAAAFYRNSRNMINQIKNVCFIIFAFILVESITIAQGWGQGMGAWVLPVLVGSSLIPIVIGALKQRKIR